ncbi:26162_t:CDS:2, partial [Racocetra persica]
EFVYQYEKNYEAIQERDCHIQAFFILVNQARLPNSREYSEKDYNKCKKHHRKPVERNDPRCKIKGAVLEICTHECCSQHTFARYDSESGPFHYILEIYKKKPNNPNGINQYIKENSSEKIIDNLFIENKSGDEIIVENAQDNPKWSRVEKGYLFSLLFPNAYERRSTDGRFWQDFNSSYEEVLINEFKGQIKYLELLNLLDPKEYSVQIKDGSENFCPKVIGFSANTNVRFIYDFCEDKELKPISEQKSNNTKLFSSFVNRLDYIVEFKKFRDDNEKPCREKCSCCKIRMIFHRGLPEDFFNFKFKIEFNYDITEEKARKILEKKYGRFEELDSIYYWKKYYMIDKNKYIIGPIEPYYPKIYSTERIYQDTNEYKAIKKKNLKENPLEYRNGIPSARYITLRHLMGLSPKSIKKYTKIFCNLIINTLTTNDSQLGGLSKIIEIDESKFKKDISW